MCYRTRQYFRKARSLFFDDCPLRSSGFSRLPGCDRKNRYRVVKLIDSLIDAAIDTSVDTDPFESGFCQQLEIPLGGRGFWTAPTVLVIASFSSQRDSGSAVCTRGDLSAMSENAVDQALCIRMRGILDDIIRDPFLYDPALIHHEHPVTELLDQRYVMADE